MKIQLLNSPLPSYMSDCLRSKCYPPLHLISLVTYTKKIFPNIETEILDGELLGKRALIERADSEIVGISCNSLSYPSAVDIAEGIKQKIPECTIILGGAHATHLYREILSNRNCFDLLVVGQGEHALVEIIKGKDRRKIPNCAFVDTNSKELITTKVNHIPINNLPFPDYSNLDISEYFKHFRKHYPEKKQKHGIPVFSSTGCHWRIKNGGCIYCSIPNKKYSFVSPKLYWDFVEKLYKNYQIDFIWDVSDTFTSNVQWIKELANEKPDHLVTGFHIYARLDNLNEECIFLLKKVGVKEVLVGIESFDNGMLKKANKGFSHDLIMKSLYMLNRYNIKVAISFVLGLPGENEETLRKTLTSLSEISWMDNIIENHASVLVPLPGSRIYKELLKKPFLRKKYLGKDLINLSELQNDYLENFTNCGANKVFDYYLKIDSIFKSAGPFFIDKRDPIYELIHFKDDQYAKI